MYAFETPRKARDKVELVTTFKWSPTLKRVAKFEINELKRATRFHSNVSIPTDIDMERYLVTVLWARIQWVNDELMKTSYGSSISSVFSRVRIPFRWSTILVNIGQVTDHNKNFKFIPDFDFNGTVSQFPNITGKSSLDQLMTKDELIEMTDIFEYLYREGYGTNVGIPRDKQGSLELMAKTKISETIRGMDETNPVYGFLAFLLDVDVASYSYDNVDLIFRTEYSSYDTYDTGFSDYFDTFKGINMNSNSGKFETTVDQNDGKGPNQPAAGKAPPNLGHNGNGAINSNGNLKD